VRLHRAGEGAPYTGLKAAGQGEGPVIAVAERAIGTGSADELVRVLTEVVAEQVKFRLDRVMALKQQEHGSVAAAREYVEATLGLQVWGAQAVPGGNQRPTPSSLERLGTFLRQGTSEDVLLRGRFTARTGVARR